MIKYEIPGMGEIEISNLCLDYNGTIAYEGKLIEGVSEKILALKSDLDIYVLTADTYGTTKKECEKLGINIVTFDRENASECKERIVKELKGNTVSFGNGLNDIQMFDNSKLSIAIIGSEGAYSGLLAHSTMVVSNILDAFNLLLDKKKIKATLRN
ncbi:MAG: ATPase P [Lachnospiraceae bacterium]|nr:ATPase P [Lachnospiraceae bacterium]